jgi:DNA-binding transcriptional MerR regulator
VPQQIQQLQSLQHYQLQQIQQLLQILPQQIQQLQQWIQVLPQQVALLVQQLLAQTQLGVTAPGLAGLSAIPGLGGSLSYQAMPPSPVGQFLANQPGYVM